MPLLHQFVSRNREARREEVPRLPASAFAVRSNAQVATNTRLGHRFADISIARGAEPLRDLSPIQRTLTIGQTAYRNPTTIRKRAAEHRVDKVTADALAPLGREDNAYVYGNWVEAAAALPKASRVVAKKRQDWWSSLDRQSVWNVSPKDPLFKQIAKECIENHDQKPYSTDALHETGPIMGGWMASTSYKEAMWKAVPALLDAKTLFGKDVKDRPEIKITRIQMFKNQALLAEYDAARQEIASRNKGNANERSLYSGHGPTGMDFIAKHGHDPSYGAYSSSKGHGAHGRGAYFTDQVDKAISYSSKDQTKDEERSFFKQDVLLGQSHEYTKRGTYRHRHHNEMVRANRSARNLPRTEGVSGTDLAAYDSLKGKKTYEPGSGLFGTAYHAKQFDSDEYMVRNADQVYVKFRIYYMLK